MYRPKTETEDGSEHWGKDFALNKEHIFSSYTLFPFVHTCMHTHTPPNLRVSFQPHRLPGSSPCSAQDSICPGLDPFAWSFRLLFFEFLNYKIHPIFTPIRAHIKSSKTRIRIQTTSNTHRQKKVQKRFYQVIYSVLLLIHRIRSTKRCLFDITSLTLVNPLVLSKANVFLLI